MSRTSTEVYMSSLAYQLGERRRVSDLMLPDDVRRRLMGPEGGLTFHLVSEASCVDLAVNSARKTLDAASSRGLRAADIDALMIASNSLSRQSGAEVIASVARSLELWRATAVLVNSGDCCNFQVAARLCHGLVASGQYRNVLLIAADRVADVCANQFVAVRGAGINSDAAASCIVSKDIRAGFKLNGHFQHAADAALLSEQSSVREGFIKFIEVIRCVFKDMCESCGVTPDQIGQLIINTYTNTVAEASSLATRLPMSKIYTKNIARTAHCFAADNLINLHDYSVDAQPEVGTLIALMGSGVYQWSAFLAEVHDPKRT